MLLARRRLRALRGWSYPLRPRAFHASK
jgi:hypothetical protein